MKKTPDFDAAESFLAAHARVLDRRAFQRLFAGGAAGPVRDAVAAYRNADGGFGYGLEPDCRAAASQPAAVEMALRIMHSCDAWDERLARDAVDWLAAVAPAEGGAAFVEASVSEGPHAPWWVPEDGHPASLIQTGQIVGLLYARGLAHPWLDRAAEVIWSRIGQLAVAGGYELIGVVSFLDQVPDRRRAEAALEQVAPLLAPGRVAPDPQAGGSAAGGSAAGGSAAGGSAAGDSDAGDSDAGDSDAGEPAHTPLDFAPRPGSIARRLFDRAAIEAHLDRLAAGQRDDGGWMFDWPSWSPAAEADWRGFLTVDALRVLRANGRA
jgi:hypothetical protein